MPETKFEVGMTCGGCASAVERILGKMDGVSDIKCDVANKSVVVTASDDVKPEDMLAKLMKWSNASGKSVKLVQ